LPGHDIKTAQEMGWDSLRNGELIQMAEEAFDVLITTDQEVEIPTKSYEPKDRHHRPADKPFAGGPGTRTQNRHCIVGSVSRRSLRSPSGCWLVKRAEVNL
jgi:hypothetical protein